MRRRNPFQHLLKEHPRLYVHKSSPTSRSPRLHKSLIARPPLKMQLVARVSRPLLCEKRHPYRHGPGWASEARPPGRYKAEHQLLTEALSVPVNVQLFVFSFFFWKQIDSKKPGQKTAGREAGAQRSLCLSLTFLIWTRGATGAPR